MNEKIDRVLTLAEVERSSQAATTHISAPTR